VVPTTADEILAALDQHPLSGAYERYLFDSIVYSAFTSDYKDNPEELEALFQEAMTAALQHLHSISKYAIMNSPVIRSASEETIYIEASSHESNTNNNQELYLPNTTTKPDLSETSSACPSRMGEGRDGPSHCPLPKVLVRSEEESLKLNRSQLTEEHLPVVALPVTDESSLSAIFIFPRARHLTPIGTIISEDCDLLTAWLFLESVYPDQVTSVPVPASTTTEELIVLLSCSSSSPMELALATILLEAKKYDDSIRSTVSLSLLEELAYKLKAYICKKCWICSDPEFIVRLEAYSNMVPEPEIYVELLVALRHHF